MGCTHTRTAIKIKHFRQNWGEKKDGEQSSGAHWTYWTWGKGVEERIRIRPACLTAKERHTHIQSLNMYVIYKFTLLKKDNSTKQMRWYEMPKKDTYVITSGKKRHKSKLKHQPRRFCDVKNKNKNDWCNKNVKIISCRQEYPLLHLSVFLNAAFNLSDWSKFQKITT